MSDPLIMLIVFAAAALLICRAILAIQEHRRRKRWEQDMRKAFRESEFHEWWGRR